MTLHQVKRWLSLAQPGDTIVYRTGKQLSSKTSELDFSDAVHAVRHYYNLGYLHLVQRRADRGFFEYTAVKRGKIVPPTKGKNGSTHKFQVPKRIMVAA